MYCLVYLYVEDTCVQHYTQVPRTYRLEVGENIVFYY